MSPQSQSTHKLGLSLSGGGFRATIFHIGVLKRLAELDLLRHVSAISTVSGGSVTGAHYLLHLKREMETGRSLSRDDYIRIVRDVESEFRRGVERNPRSRLFLNFLRNLKIFCFAEPPGERMADIYHASFFRSVTGAKKPIRLKDTLVNIRITDLAEHNLLQAEDPSTPTQLVPRLILNSSCLNSGREFLFTAAEVGDPQLGFIRVDEARLVTDCKRMLADEERQGLDLAWTAFNALPERDDEKTGRAAVRNQKAAIRWFLDMERAVRRENSRRVVPMKAPGATADSPVLASLAGRPELAKKLFEAEFRCLRMAKVAAWYLLDTKDWGPTNRRGGFTPAQHWERFCRAVDEIDVALARVLGAEPALEQNRGLLQFVACLFYLRSARAFAWDVERGLGRLRLVDAVAASANFPPVFTPYHIRDIYDAGRIRVLSLTDGGVHDNLGIRSLMDDECTDLIVSDAGGLYQESSSPAGDRVRMMARIGSVLTAHVRNLELDKLHDVAGASAIAAAARAQNVAIPDPSDFTLSSTAFFHMLSNPTDADPPRALPPHPHAQEIAHIRTDLDVFGSVEIDALIYQGYQLADRFVREYLGKDLWHPDAVRPPQMTAQAGPRVRKILAAGSKRIGRWQAIHPVAGWVIGLATLAVLVAEMARRNLTMVQALRAVIHAPVALVTMVVPPLAGLADRIGDGTWGIGQRILSLTGVQSAAAILGVAIALFLLSSDWLERALATLLVRGIRGNARLQMHRLKVARFLGPWRRNLTWLLWLFPLWLALFGTVACSILMLGGLVTRYATSHAPARERTPLDTEDTASKEANQ